MVDNTKNADLYVLENVPKIFHFGMSTSHLDNTFTSRAPFY